MGVIWTSKTRTRQPSGVVPIAPQFQNKLLYLGGRHTGWRNQSGSFSTVPSSLATGSAWEGGEATRFNASDKITSPTFPNVTGGNPQTLFAFFKASSAPNTYAVVASVDDISGNTVGRLQYNAGATDINYYSGNTSYSVITPIAGKWYAIAIIDDGSTLTAVVNGSATSITRTTSTNTATSIYIGGYGGSGALYNSDIALAGFWSKSYPVPAFIEVTKNPWQLFAPEKRPLFFSTGGGANNTGTLAVTLDAATLTGVGGAARSGTLATTLDAATLTGVGNVTRSGTLAVTLDAATLAGTGAVTRSGTLSSTLDAVTLAGVGSVAVGTNRDGTLAVTLDAATLAGIGAVTRSGTLAVTLDAATLAGVGTAGQAITGTLGVTLGNVTLAGIGAIPAAPSAGGGKTFGSNKKKKKQRKAIESEEWLKAEETAKQLLQDRFTKTTPEAKLEALATHIESLQPVIEALKALAGEDVQEAVQETRTEELTEHQVVLNRFDALEKKIESVEELLIILMADL